jgi:hypothetical protein
MLSSVTIDYHDRIRVMGQINIDFSIGGHDRVVTVMTQKIIWIHDLNRPMTEKKNWVMTGSGHDTKIFQKHKILSLE